jgi:polar amino acid transport system substrate-binding protein
MPWARGYYTAQKEPLNILFVTARTEERENLFKWVGPIFTDRTEAFALKKKKIKINSSRDFSKYIISSYIRDSQEELISSLGIPVENLDRLTSSDARFKKLYSGRTDIVFTSRITFLDFLSAEEIDPNIFESLYILDSIDICYAFSTDTPDWVIEKFQNILNELHEDGTIEKIFTNYGLSWAYEKPNLK